MARPGSRLFDWLDSRTGCRAGLTHVLDEPLPSGVNWWFTFGSILLFLLFLQLLTGIVLTIYYVPTPDHAYDSVRFITSEVTFGRIVRGLHFFGASFSVIAAVVHMLRVIAFGSYKAPREMTWVSGVVLLLIILSFALSGYLLPWDQRAYWATVVTINIARSTPVIGTGLANLIRGGSGLGALTLSRWYSAHVILLPLALGVMVITHLFLMRRHGISGPTRPREGAPHAFYPYHAIKDTLAIAAVFAVLLTLAIGGRSPLDAMADPSDATYIPRPEWYFLGLFQLLKYFPGRLEPVAAIGVPGALVALLFLLPFIDRRPDRDMSARRVVLAATGVIVSAIALLTVLGLRDSPAPADVNLWGPRALTGRTLAAADTCTRCHTAGGAGVELAASHFSRDDEWMLGHFSDPEMIAPGLRPRPRNGLTPLRGQAVLAYIRKLRAGARPPQVSAEEQATARVIALQCSNCHIIDGEGGTDGPSLSVIGRKRSAEWLARWISDPAAIDPEATMPSFEDKLTEAELRDVVGYLARRK